MTPSLSSVALAAVLAVCWSSNVQAQFGFDFDAIMDRFSGSNPSFGRGPPPKPQRPRGGPTLSPSQVSNQAGPLFLAHPVARPAILKCVLLPGGVSAAAEGIAFTLSGLASGNADALAIGSLSQNAQAVAKACAQAVVGTALANSLARASGVNALAAAQSIAEVCKGIAVASSKAETRALFNGVAISDARARAIWGVALANAKSSCVSELGGCTAVSNAVAQTVKGPAFANAVSECLSKGRGGNCVASSSATATSGDGPALASSSSTAIGKRKMMAAAAA